jgi:hypothetical protein
MLEIFFEAMDNNSLIKILKKCSEGMFFTAYIFIIAFYRLAITTFPSSITILTQPLFDLLPGILILFKVVFTEYREWKRWPAYILAVTLGLLVDHYSAEDYLYTTIIILIGANHISFKKILKTYCIVEGAIVLSALVCSLTGVIRNITYWTGDRGFRRSYGIFYPLDCAACYLYLYMTFLYVFRKSLKWWCGFSGFIISGLLWYGTKSRTNCFCLVLVSVLFMIFKLRDTYFPNLRIPDLLRTIYRKLCKYSIPFWAFLVIAASYYYEKLTVISGYVPDTFMARFYFGCLGLKNYGVKLFGQYVALTTNAADYFFLDSAFQQLLIMDGLIAFIVVIVAYVYFAEKFKTDKYLLMLLAVIALQNSMEFHLIDLSYNSFIIALTAVTTTAAEENKPLSAT